LGKKVTGGVLKLRKLLEYGAEARLRRDMQHAKRRCEYIRRASKEQDSSAMPLKTVAPHAQSFLTLSICVQHGEPESISTKRTARSNSERPYHEDT
jgi:hypothetical protein